MLILILLLLMMPAVVHAQAEQEKPDTPPIAQPLVREGAVAVKLVSALALGSIEDEAEAESRLGEAGIAPRNGWIADYPVTPDIVGELQAALREAADSGKLSMSRDEALKKLDGSIAEAGLAVKPYVDGQRYEAKPTDAEKYPNPTETEVREKIAGAIAQIPGELLVIFLESVGCFVQQGVRFHQFVGVRN